MRILVYTHEFPPDVGGAGQYCRDLAAHLGARGHDVLVAVGREAWRVRAPSLPEDPPGILVRRFASGPVEHLDYATVGLRLRRFVRGFRPDVLVVGDGKASVGAGGVPLPRGPKVALVVHGTEVTATLATRVRLRFYARTMRRAHALLPVSAYSGTLARDAYASLGIPMPPMRVVPNGVDLARYLAPRDDAAVADVRARHGLPAGPLLVALGRLVPRKGHDVAIRAMAQVAARVPGATYAIAGDGPDRARLEKIARDVGVLGSSVRFLGMIPARDKIPLLDAADLFFLMSRREGLDVEGFGIVFAEAAARGKVVVAGRHGGVTEAVEDGVTGVLLDPLDAEAAAEAAVALLADPARRSKLGEAARARARERFDWSRIAADAEEFLASLA